MGGDPDRAARADKHAAASSGHGDAEDKELSQHQQRLARARQRRRAKEKGEQPDAGENAAGEGGQAQAGAIAEKPAVEYRSGLGVGNAFKLFDAQLDRTQETLTLIVRIKFNFVPSNDKKPWPKEASAKFAADFKSQVESFWSDRFLLVPDGPCNDPVQKCHAYVRVEPVQSNPHYEASVKWVEGHKQESSNTNSYDHKAELHADDNNAAPVYLGPGKHSQQVPSAHEFGHMIGLHHINEDALAKDPKANPYGDTLEQQMNIMGMGDMIAPENYLPFTTAMNAFTGCPWTTSKL